MKSKNIVMLFNKILCFNFGHLNAMLEILLYLKDKGNNVEILVINDNYEYFSQNIAILQNLDGCKRIISDKNINKYKYKDIKIEVLRTAKYDYRIIDSEVLRHKYDYFITLEVTSLVFVALLGLPGAHFVHNYDGILPSKKDEFLLKIIRKRVIFSCSRYMKKYIKKEYDLESKLWYPIFNLSRFYVNRPERKSKIIGFITRGNNKGLAIVKKIIRKMPLYNFYIAGDLENPIIKKPKNMNYLGSFKDIRKFYKQIDILIAPSIWNDPFGRVILEASSNGIPVIANNVGGISEAIGKSGVILETNIKPNKIVSQYVLNIEDILSDEKKYQFLSSKALIWAKEFETEQKKMMDRNYDLYIK